MKNFLRRTLRRDKLRERKGPARLRWDLENAVEARLERHRQVRTIFLDEEIEMLREVAKREIGELLQEAQP